MRLLRHFALALFIVTTLCAHAQVVTGTTLGTIGKPGTSGSLYTDTNGLFGPAGTDLTGQIVHITYSYNVADYNPGMPCTGSVASDPCVYYNSQFFTSAYLAFTINGVTKTYYTTGFSTVIVQGGHLFTLMLRDANGNITSQVLFDDLNGASFGTPSLPLTTDTYFDSFILLNSERLTFTPYCNANGGDSDFDGLCNDWETKGILDANGNKLVDLPSMGADPMRKDIFVQADYMVGGAGDNHKPDPQAIKKVVNAFAAQGINLHVDCGSDCSNGSGVWGTLSKANALPHMMEIGCNYLNADQTTTYDWTVFNATKELYFPAERAKVFHYMIFAHNEGGICFSGGPPDKTAGISKATPGSDFLVTLGQSTKVLNIGRWTEQAGVFMHELGHNLSLKHGGDEDTNYKPNYLSVMNYRFARNGLLVFGQSDVYDYSEVALPSLDENALNESVGIFLGPTFSNYGTAFSCAGKNPAKMPFETYIPASIPIDWNCDKVFVPSSADINSDGNKSILHGYYDWANLVFIGGAVGANGDSFELPTMTPGEPTPDPVFSSDSLLQGPEVSVFADRTAALMHNGTNTLTFTIANQGAADDVYVLSATSSLPWIDTSALPASFAVGAGKTAQVTIPVSVPVNISSGTTGTLSLIANTTSTTPSIQGPGEFTIDLTVADSAESAAIPIFSPAAGTFTTGQTVSIADTTTGAAIYYSTNGTAPTTSSTLYTGPITVSSSETIQAIAIASGYTTSPVATAAYTITLPTATPTFSPAPRTFTAPQTVSIADTTPGAAIYFTTDGTTPTTSSTLYTGPIVVSSKQTIQAIAVASGYSSSPVATATYTINQPIPTATPTFSPASGTFTAAQTVSIADATAGAAIYYSTNNVTPTSSSTLYTGPITVSSSQTIQAIAVAAGYTTSPVATAAYTINIPTAAATPIFSPNPGTFTAAQTVTIADATAGATIYYTTNGVTPTTSSTLYTGPIAVSSSQTIQAIAVASGYTTSPVASVTYTITLPQDFGLGLSTTSLAVTAGQSGTLTASITPGNGFNQAVAFTCSGLPAGSACSFSPATLTANGTAVGNTTVTVTTAAKTSLLERNRPFGLAGLLAGVGLWFAGRRFRRLGCLGALLLMTIGLGSFISGCGTNPIAAPEPTTSVVSINAVSGSLTHTATFSLTVK